MDSKTSRKGTRAVTVTEAAVEADFQRRQREGRDHRLGGDDCVLREAHRLVYGDRNADYGHPHDDFKRAVGMFNAYFADILKSDLAPWEWGVVMMFTKLSRQAHKPKRDNMVDLAGFADCTQQAYDRDFEGEEEG